MKTILASFLILTATAACFADEPAPASPTLQCTVKLQYGKDVDLSADNAQRLREASMELLESANFNSNDRHWLDLWGVAKIQENYRQTITGKYLLLSFKEPQHVDTLGGKMTVVEVVVGIPEQGWPSLFSIDDQNRIACYTKYGCPESTKILELIKRAAGNN